MRRIPLLFLPAGRKRRAFHEYPFTSERPYFYSKKHIYFKQLYKYMELFSPFLPQIVQDIAPCMQNIASNPFLFFFSVSIRGKYI